MEVESWDEIPKLRGVLQPGQQRLKIDLLEKPIKSEICTSFSHFVKENICISTDRYSEVKI
jgi:hypothetical protein